MKKTAKILGLILLLAGVFSHNTSHAQLLKGGYFNVDWQFNSPVGNDYANVATGWGMSFEGGYYIIPNMSVGLFVAYHSNNKYIGEQTLQLNPTEALYTDQQHALYQVPFGAASYTRMESITQVYTYYDKQWGFTVQPEVGITIYPMPFTRTGIHLAIYYNYSTNKSHVLTYNIDGYNNIGFHLGISF